MKTMDIYSSTLHIIDVDETTTQHQRAKQSWDEHVPIDMTIKLSYL
jgi:hypothetical protein